MTIDREALKAKARENAEAAMQRAKAARAMHERQEEIPPNPLEEIEYTGNVEEDSRLEGEVMAAVLKQKEARERQAAAVDLANETEFWFAMYFQTREQKDAFLKAVKWFEMGDKYLDGLLVAKEMGVELPPRQAPYKVGRIDKKLAALT